MESNRETEIMHLMRSLQNLVRRNGKTGSNSDNSRWRILKSIAREAGITQSKLAEILEIRPQSLTRVLNDLETEGYIIRERNSSDRRVIKLHLTEKGNEYCSHRKTVFRETAVSVFSVLSDDEKNQLRYLLEKVITAEKGKES